MTLDPLVGAGEFDFIKDLGAQMPMRVIGMLLGIPEDQQQAIRDRTDSGLHLEEGSDMGSAMRGNDDEHMAAFGEYIDWRSQHLGDDVMSELIQTEFEDETARCGG